MKGILGAVSRKYSHRIPFILKVNHNEFLSYPNSSDQADIIKQKLPENNGGFTALKFGKTSRKVYEELTTDNPIDLCRYQVANCYMGRAGLSNSGGESKRAPG